MRLIDADAIDRNTFVKAVGENGGFISFGDCLEMLKNQPTAYDVDAVVEELTKIKGYYGYYSSEECEYVPYLTTVGIVRKGGVNE